MSVNGKELPIGLLNAYLGMTYWPPIELPSGSGSAMKAEKTYAVQESDKDISKEDLKTKTLYAIPNPVQDEMEIHFELSAQIEFSTLSIVNIQGVVLEELEIRSPMKFILYSTYHLPEGLYVIYLQQGLVLSNHYLGHADSIWVDSLFHWLDQYPDVNTRYFRAQGALLAGNTTDAIAEMDSIGLLFESGSTEASAHASFKRAIEYATEQLDSSQYITNLLNWHRDSLEAWASDGLTHQGRQSQALLNYADSLQYFPVIVLPAEASGSTLSRPERPDVETKDAKGFAALNQEDGELIVIPNPVTGLAEIRYELSDGWGLSKLWIVNATGKQLFENELAVKDGSIHVDCSHWQSGIYVVLVQSESGLLLTTRFSIIKQ